jgi:hypothetical protein
VLEIKLTDAEKKALDVSASHVKELVEAMGGCWRRPERHRLFHTTRLFGGDTRAVGQVSVVTGTRGLSPAAP